MAPIQKASASDSITLDQTSYTQVANMTITPGAGDYLAMFSMDVTYDATPTAAILKIAIYVNNVIQSHTEREIQSNSSLANMTIGVCTSCLVSPTAGQVVDVRYIIDGDQMTGTLRELTLFPAPGTNYQDTDTVDDTIASDTWTTLDNMTRTPASGNYLLVFTTSAAPASTEIVEFRLSVGGTPVAHSNRRVMIESSANPTSYCTMIAASINPNGSQVVEIEWHRYSGTGTHTCHERNMILIGVPSGDIFQASGTVSDSDSTADTDVLIDDMTITDPGKYEFLVLFSSFQWYGSLSAPGAGTYYKIYSGGSEELTLTRYFEHEDSIDNNYMSVFMTGRIVLYSTTEDIQGYWRGDQTNSRTVYTRTLVAVRGDAIVTYKLEGITYDKDAVALGSVDCYLYKDNGDNTLTFMDYVLSHATTGAYSFTGMLDNDAAYLVVFIKDGSPNVFDVTDHVLQPVAE